MRAIVFSAVAIMGLAGVPCLADISGFDREFATAAFRANVSAIQDAQWGNQTDQPQSVKIVAQRVIRDHSNALGRLKEISQQLNFTLPSPASTDQTSDRGRLKNEDGEALRQDYLERELARRQEEMNLCEREIREGNVEALRNYCGDNLPNLHEQLSMLRSAQSHQ